MTIVAYCRISTDKQDLNNQELEIRRYCDEQGMVVDHWIKVQMSSRKDATERKIDLLMDALNGGDTLIVSELSRLGRSVGAVITLIDKLVSNKTRVVCLKEDLTFDSENKDDITSQVMLTMLALLAQVERTLISQRTKAGLARAKAEGKQIGRPKGPGKSMLDGRRDEIIGYLSKGISKRAIAKLVDAKYTSLLHYIKVHKLNQ